jgi:hypothetical protein
MNTDELRDLVKDLAVEVERIATQLAGENITEEDTEYMKDIAKRCDAIQDALMEIKREPATEGLDIDSAPRGEIEG